MGVNQLCAALQDMWHYAALIKPPSSGLVSTFDGDKYHAGLPGLIRAYDSLRVKISAWQIECLPAFCGVSLPESAELNTLEEMREHVGYAIHAINVVAQANGINAYHGKLSKEVL